MNEAADKAIEVLVTIATDENEDSDVRIRAACSILDFHKFTTADQTAKTLAAK